MKRSLLYKHIGDISASLVQRRLDDGAHGKFVGIGLEFEKVCLEKHLLQQFRYAYSLFGRYFLTLVFSAPVFHKDIHFRKLTADSVRISTRLVYFVDCKHHRYTGGLRVIDSLNCLGHHGIVCGHDDDGKVGQLCATGTHSSERFVSRSIEERNAASVGKFHAVGTDVLRDSSGLTCNHVGLADIVEQRSLAVVHVPHHRNDGRSGLEIFGIVRLFVGIYLFRYLRCHELNLIAEFLGHKHKSLRIETLVDGHHQTEAHTSSYDLHHRSVVHKGGKVVHSHELSHLQDLVLGRELLHLLLCALGRQLSLFLAVFGSEVILPAFIHLGISLLDLLLDFLLHLFDFRLRHCRFELLSPVTPALSLRLLQLLLTRCFLLSGITVYIRPSLGHIHFLAAFADSLPLCRFAVELTEIDLPDNFERRRGRCLFFLLHGLGHDSCNRFGIRF